LSKNHDTHSAEQDWVEMPRPTAAPLVLAAGIGLLALGVATSLAFVPAGAIVFVFALARWINQLVSPTGHFKENFVTPELRPQPIVPAAGEVEKLARGVPGYRLRLPVKVHPISAGVKGAIVGGFIMPLPALAYGHFSGHGIWWPGNLLAGLVLPSVGRMSVLDLEQFHPAQLVASIIIHAVVCLIIGLIFGVLMPTLPSVPKPIAWGALLMPLLWTAVSFFALGRLNPDLRGTIEWPWFVLSQFIFGIVAAIVFMGLKKRSSLAAGILGGIAGGLLMPIPAILWSLAARHGIWYPVNLLAAMVTRFDDVPITATLEAYHGDWFATSLVVHAVLSVSFGLAFALVLPRLPQIPSPLAWGGLVFPLLWTAMSYSLMGVVNPVLQQFVNWPWFIFSQFVFGIAAAIVVVRSEQVFIPPAGKGPDRRAEYVAN
jgi:hypothetical protein